MVTISTLSTGLSTDLTLVNGLSPSFPTLSTRIKKSIPMCIHISWGWIFHL